MRWKTSRPQLETVEAGGPADTATVVIGIDDVPACWDAFCWACGEARRLGGRAVAVLISPAAATVQARQLLTEMMHEAGDLDLTVIDAPGDPVTELLRIAREVHADLLVVGGTSAHRHRLMGAVGPRLAARRREPVIVVVPSSNRTML
jgi:nucleotide-binding universal stress UspA family protein